MSSYKRQEVSLSYDLTLDAKQEKAITVDLEGEWAVSARVSDVANNVFTVLKITS